MTGPDESQGSVQRVVTEPAVTSFDIDGYRSITWVPCHMG